MNRYLDDATKKRIKDRFMRFDNREIIGKTVAKAIYSGEVAGVSFTDGTWSAVLADGDYEEPELNPNVDFSGLDLYVLRGLGLITEEEFKSARLQQEEAEKSRKLERLRQLQSELGIKE